MIVKLDIDTRFLRGRESIAYGLQNWLYSRGFVKHPTKEFLVDPEPYKALLLEFCRTQDGFDENRVTGLETLEKYTDQRFSAFCEFCIKKYKK